MFFFPCCVGLDLFLSSNGYLVGYPVKFNSSPLKNGGKEDKPFLLGPGNSSGAGSFYEKLCE